MNEQNNIPVTNDSTGTTQTTIIIGSKYIMNQKYQIKTKK